jgi:hypothetical protein
VVYGKKLENFEGKSRMGTAWASLRDRLYWRRVETCKVVGWGAGAIASFA